MNPKIPPHEPRDPLAEPSDQDLPAEQREQLPSAETAIAAPFGSRAGEAEGHLPTASAQGEPVSVLVPVIPDDPFYDAVVAAGSLLAERGGSLTFLFLHTQPPDDKVEDQEGGPKWDEDVLEQASAEEIEAWQNQQIASLDEARQLLLERGVPEEVVSYRFAEGDNLSADILISQEVERGSYDAVVLPEGAPLEPDSATVGATTDEVIEALRRDFPEIELVTTGAIGDPYQRPIMDTPSAFGETEQRIHDSYAEAGEGSGYPEYAMTGGASAPREQYTTRAGDERRHTRIHNPELAISEEGPASDG